MIGRDGGSACARREDVTACEWCSGTPVYDGGCQSSVAKSDEVRRECGAESGMRGVKATMVASAARRRVGGVHVGVAAYSEYYHSDISSC